MQSSLRVPIGIGLVIATILFGGGYYAVGRHKPRPFEQLLAHCQDTAPENNRARVKACRAILARQTLEPWYRGAINTQLCAALGRAERWKKMIDACTKGNDPYPQYANYVNRAVAYDMLGQKDKAEADRVEAALIKPLPQPRPPASH